jgi:hypothetical protein
MAERAPIVQARPPSPICADQDQAERQQQGHHHPLTAAIGAPATGAGALAGNRCGSASAISRVNGAEASCESKASETIGAE